MSGERRRGGYRHHRDSRCAVRPRIHRMIPSGSGQRLRLFAGPPASHDTASPSHFCESLRRKKKRRRNQRHHSLRTRLWHTPPAAVRNDRRRKAPASEVWAWAWAGTVAMDRSMCALRPPETSGPILGRSRCFASLDLKLMAEFALSVHPIVMPQVQGENKGRPW